MKRNVAVACSGKSGKGKGWYAGYLIEQSNKPRVLWDKKGEHAGLSDAFMVLTPARLRGIQAGGARKVWRDILERYPSLRITTKGLEPQQMAEAAGECAYVVQDIGNRLWAGTEYHLLAPNGGPLGTTHSGLIVLHTDARTCQVDIIFDSQRPANVNTTIMSQANRRVGFGMDDPNDIKRTAGYFAAVPADQLAVAGIQHLAKGRDAVPAAEVFPHMPPMRCLHLDCDSGQQVMVDTSRLTRRVPHRG